MRLDNLYAGINMTKLMFGQDAIKVPVWMVVQNQGDAGVMIAGASRSPAPMFGSDKIHVMVLGEIIICPRLVLASDQFAGRGIGSFWTDPATPKEWLDHGEIIINTLEV